MFQRWALRISLEVSLLRKRNDPSCVQTGVSSTTFGWNCSSGSTEKILHRMFSICFYMLAIFSPCIVLEMRTSLQRRQWQIYSCNDTFWSEKLTCAQRRRSATTHLNEEKKRNFVFQGVFVFSGPLRFMFSLIFTVYCTIKENSEIFQISTSLVKKDRCRTLDPLCDLCDTCTGRNT